MTRNIKAAMNVLRQKGIKAGCFRPVTLNPFPAERISELAKEKMLNIVNRKKKSNGT